MPTTNSQPGAPSSDGSPEALWLHLLEDSAALAPAGFGIAAALDAHRIHRQSWYADLVGPLLLAASDLAALLPLVAAGEDLRVGLIADTGLAGLVESLGQLTDHEDRVVVPWVQIPLPSGFPAAESTAALLDQLALSRTTFVEVPVHGYEGALDVVADDGAERIAYRLGAPTDGLGGFIHAAVDRRVAFRIAGGMQGGALNVLAGVATALAGGSVAAVTHVLVEPAAEQLAAILATADVRAIRGTFVGFDCRDVSELVADLLEAGLVAKA